MTDDVVLICDHSIWDEQGKSFASFVGAGFKNYTIEHKTRRLITKTNSHAGMFHLIFFFFKHVLCHGKKNH